MKTMLDLPEDLAVEVQRRAAADGRDLADEVVELVRKGLAAPFAEPPPLAHAVIITDPDTGLPVILSPPDAPISRMTTDEILHLMREFDEEEELERFARSLRR
jgi:plasmid stability protein